MNGEFAPELIIFGFLVSVAALDTLTWRRPWLGIALGAGFLALAVLAGVLLKGSSQGGLWVAVVLLWIVTPAFLLALWFLGCGIYRLRSSARIDPKALPGQRLKERVAVAVLGVLALGIAGSVLYSALDLGGDTASKGLAREGDAYRLSWGAALWKAPALELVVTEADLWPDLGPRSYSPFEGSPTKLSLRIVDGDAAGALLTLHRERPRDALSRQESSLWFSTEGGRWKLLGVDCADRMFQAIAAAGAELPRCHSPPSSLARHFPGRHGLERVSLWSEDTRQGCSAAFTFRGRHAVLETDASCLTARTWHAFESAVFLLDRLAGDATTAPDASTRLARAQGAVANCEAVARASRQQAASVARKRVSLACGYATQLARALPGEHATEAAALARRAELASEVADR